MLLQISRCDPFCFGHGLFGYTGQGTDEEKPSAGTHLKAIQPTFITAVPYAIDIEDL